MNENKDLLKLLPLDIKEKYNYLRIENKYINVMSIVSYEKIVFLELMEQILNQENVRITFHVSKQNGQEFLKKITRFVSESNAELKSIKSNQIDKELIENNKIEAEEIKKEVQVNNEEIYLVETYIQIEAGNEVELINMIAGLKNLLYTRGIILKPLFFKQKYGYKAMLPLLNERKLLSNYNESIMLTGTLAMLFPFFVKENIDENGVFVGKVNKKNYKLSILTENNLNYNMCVFGSSGVGKSFFIKLLIMRNIYKGMKQIIIDPECEYMDIVKELGGCRYDMDTYNPLYINEDFAKKNVDFLSKTIDLVLEYIESKYHIKDKDIKDKIIELYGRYGINEKIESLYDYSAGEDIYISPKYKNRFPRVSELLTELNVVSTKNINQENFTGIGLHCFCIKGKNTNEIEKEMKVFLPKLKQLIGENTIVYFDEIWKLISVSDDNQLIEEIYNFFKTLRKRRAGIVAISQDVGDLFNLDKGNFGKSILNNSYTKVFFKMSYADIDKMKEIYDEHELIKTISKLKKGEAYIKQGENNFVLEIIANEYEKNLIEGVENYEENINSNR